jgi:hypothetical protein
MKTSICSVNPCFPSSGKNSVCYTSFRTTPSLLPATLCKYFFLFSLLIVSSLHVEHIAFVTLLFLVDFGDTEMYWLIGKKMPFHVPLQCQCFGSVQFCHVELTQCSLECQWLVFPWEK